MKFSNDPIRSDENLALPLEVDGGHWDGVFRKFLWVLCGFIVFLVLLATVAPVREVALADGEIVPLGSVVTVEHLEGGIVDTVHVSEGASVEQGDLLISLSKESGSGDFNQIRVRRDTLEMRRLRLAALLEGRDVDFGQLGERYPTEASDQRLLFNTEKTAVAAGDRVLRARLEQRRSDLNAREVELQSIKARIDIFTEQVGAQRRLIQRGFSSRGRLLQAKARLEEVRADRAQVLGAIENTKGSILEVESEIVQATNAKRQEWSDNLIETINEIAELEQRLTGASDRVARLSIVAPKSGRIQMLAARRPGEVIRPGDVVAEIVPDNVSVEAEVRILPKDIGYVTVGLPAQITLSTFDPEVFGKVEGEVRSISPTTFENDQGEKYFKGKITLDRNSLSLNDRSFAITPGMIVSASVKTGSKSIMQYLLKPVLRSYDRAFSER